MRHVALLNAFTAVRMLLTGKAVLVRTERWNAVSRLERYARHRDDCDKRRAFQGACTCGLEAVLLAVYYPSGEDNRE